ncbi:MAG: hypothetical protein V1754_14165 [Pseudomonadota bacterium]
MFKFAIVSCLALLVEGSAFAYDFRVTARTEGYGYQLRRYDQNGLTFLNRRQITQYLGLQIYNLLDPGQLAYKPNTRQPPALLYAHALMRFFADFGDYADPIGSNPELRNNQFELLVGAIEGRNLLGWIDFSLGRQFEAELMDFFAYDGLRVRVNTPWNIFVETYVGVQVDRTAPFSPAVFEIDGVTKDENEKKIWAPTFGLAVGVDDFERFDLRMAYRGVASKFDVADQSRVANAAGDSASQSLWGIDQELLFLSAGYRLPLVETQAMLGTRFNMLTGEVDDFQVGVAQRLGTRHQFQVDFLRSRPHFDGDSIFNIFATEPFTEIGGQYTIKLFDPMTLYSRVGYRWFWTDPAEGESPKPGATSLAAGANWRNACLSSGLELFYLDGYGGRKIGGDADVGWNLLRWLTLEGRMSLVGLEEDQRTDSSTLTFGLQLGGRVQFIPGVILHVMAEDNISELYTSAFRLLAVLDLEFTP